LGSGEDSLGLLALSSKSTEGTSVAVNIEAGLFQELSYTVIDENVVKVFSSEMIISISGPEFEDTNLNGKDRNT
jgi:hypothetical protein